MTHKLKVFVADDEPQPLASLVSKINKSLTMEVVGQGNDIKDSFHFIINHEVDVLFLDIKLIEGDAFSLISKLRLTMKSMPPVVLFTGFTEFDFAQKTINDFKDCVVLLLQKPFWKNWEQKEDEILKEVFNYRLTHGEVLDKISVRSQNTTYLLKIDDIVSMSTDENNKSSGKIILFSIKNGALTLNDSLSSFEKKLNHDFQRISKYAIVNKTKIERFDHINKLLYLEELTSPFKVGEKYEEDLLKILKS
jgi:DNA-binding LytR/AlgR family response regulator